MNPSYSAIQSKLPGDVCLVTAETGHPSAIKPVTVYPSRLSLNAWYGCPLGCRYCCLPFDGLSDEPEKPKKITDTDTLLAAYDQCQNIKPIRRLKITLGDHSDPFLTPVIAQDTLKILQGLAKRGATASILLTTKMFPGLALLEAIAELRSTLKLSLFVSMADTSDAARVEPANMDDRIKTLQACKSLGLHTVMYLKPIGWWTSPALLSQLVEAHRDDVDEIVISPLQSQTVFRQGEENTAELFPSSCYGGDLEDQLVEMLHRVAPAIPVSRKRSCAVNRRWKLKCQTPIIYTPAKSSGDLFHNTIRDDDGYCHVIPEKSYGGLEAGMVSALSKVRRMLNKNNVEWAIIGSFQRALTSGSSFSSVNDIDIALSKSDLRKMHSTLAGDNPTAELWMGMDCEDCSRRGRLKPVEMKAITSTEDHEYRATLRLVVDGTSFDFSTKNMAAGQELLKKHVAGMEVPVLLALNQRSGHQGQLRPNVISTI